ncbi:mycothiol synthase [Nocardioides panacisoli]|uniref:mycothiol synthase n=1 Tax=Nocardioides panacisoli TaxID=627624 RepID=UPI001C63ACF4|nr:mycothiol synthase [Nocardioides panacisoli]QYJ03917.1 mycothiol synthase [Nocardioides panacisoli]
MSTPDPADVDPTAVVAAVRRACRDAGEPDPLDEAADLRLVRDGLTALPHWVATDGFAVVRDEELDLAVAPHARRHGTGADLVGRAVAATPGRLTAWSHGDHPGAAALAAAYGFERVRELWVMRRPTAEPLPQAGVPDDVTVRSFRPGADEDALLAVNAAAFADHPEQGDLDRDGLAQRMAEPWFDPDDLLLAVAPDGELLGFHWTKRHDAEHGEVYVVGVAPSAQGRGLGRVLTVAGLAHLAERGIAEVHLYVEGDNTPATTLYGDLGFTRARSDTHVQYLRG